MEFFHKRTWAEIDLAAAEKNLNILTGFIDETKTRPCCVLKAFGYGHGDINLMKLYQTLGVDFFAVSNIDEAIGLRRHGCTGDILILGYTAPQYAAELSRFDIIQAAVSEEYAKELSEAAKSPVRVHIKLDTGMHRLGFMTSELAELEEYLASTDRVKVKSIFSHLAAAEDPESDAFTLGQIEMFNRNATALTDSLGYRPMLHILNSAGIERFPQYQYDMVRLGIGIYGVSALPGVQLAPVASFKCKILQIKNLKPEDGTIGYGRHGQIAPEGTTIATIPVGYADGIDRHLGCGHCSFLLNGHRVPTIGNICMDMCMLDITGVPAQVGDTVTIFGKEPTISELADILGTIPYEILTSVPRRIERVVISGPAE